MYVAGIELFEPGARKKKRERKRKRKRMQQNKERGISFPSGNASKGNEKFIRM